MRWLKIVFVAAAAVPALAFAQPQEVDEADRDLTHARVSALDGELFVKGPWDEEELEVTVNYVLREGDELRTGPDSMAEIEMPRSTFVRLAPQASAKIESIDNEVQLTLVRGSSYLSQGADAPDVSIRAQNGSTGTFSRSVVRFEAETGSDAYAITRVAEGSAEAECNGQDVTTLAVREVLVCENSNSRRERWAEGKEDAFDRWSAAREKATRTYTPPPAQVAGEYEGMQDLEGNGQWVVVEHRHYWRPVVDLGWRPYYDGYWAWNHRMGWNWVSYRPWGYVTHHYGRWVWLSSYGWVWSPAARFAPAWVVWASFDGYLGWAPCDFWGRPVVVVSTHSHYDHYAWNFSRPHYFNNGGGNHRHRRHAAAHERPFFTMAPDEIRNVRPRPLKDPRDLAPQNPLVRQRPQLASSARPERDRPRPSVLPRIIDEDARRPTKIHEAARERVPTPPKQREIVNRLRDDSDDGIPIQRARPVPRGSDHDDRIAPRPVVRENEQIDRAERPESAERPRTVDRPDTREQPREQPRVQEREQPRYQPREQPQVRPETQVRPATKPQVQERPRGFTPPRLQQPNRTVRTPSKPVFQPQSKPQVQPQPQPKKKPSYTPAKPVLKPSAPVTVKKAKKK
jgi:hypothetical protein